MTSCGNRKACMAFCDSLARRAISEFYAQGRLEVYVRAVDHYYWSVAILAQTITGGWALADTHVSGCTCVRAPRGRPSTIRLLQVPKTTTTTSTENHYRKPLPVPKTIRLLQVPHFGSLLPHHICPRISCQELLRSETQNASASWNVLMQRRRIAWAFTGNPKIHWVHLVMHPVILVGPITADTFVDGLRHNTKLALRVESFIEKWSSRAATASPCIPFRNR